MKALCYHFEFYIKSKMADIYSDFIMGYHCVMQHRSLFFILGQAYIYTLHVPSIQGLLKN